MSKAIKRISTVSEGHVPREDSELNRDESGPRERFKAKKFSTSSPSYMMTGNYQSNGDKDLCGLIGREKSLVPEERAEMDSLTGMAFSEGKGGVKSTVERRPLARCGRQRGKEARTSGRRLVAKRKTTRHTCRAGTPFGASGYNKSNLGFRSYSSWFGGSS
nr:hypothetical protein Iba_chr02bCG17100 [Ipomoea batatas]